MPPNVSSQEINNQPPPQPGVTTPAGNPTDTSSLAPKDTPRDSSTQAQPASSTALTNAHSTQNTLLISEVRDSLVIMKDGSFRAVIECESINFDLMSEQEREGVEFSYQNFLNSLSFPIQILVRSQRVDIGPYIDQLLDLRRNQGNMLLNVLMDDYIKFIDILSQEANIMDKFFYIVIPYFPTGDMSDIIKHSRGFFKQIFSKQQESITKVSAETYAKAQEELGNRINLVQTGLLQIGVRNKILDTRKLSELYYNSYNPDIAVRQPLTDPSGMSSIYVKKGQKPEAVN